MIDVRMVQHRLKDAGYDPGSVDGDLGPKSFAALFGFVARRDLGVTGTQLGIGADRYFTRYEITNQRRIAHFLAQAAHETGAFHYFTEIWGPTPAQRGYEGRRDLGNVNAGDGVRFKGRGIFQLTGRANYRKAGQRLSLPLEAEPELAAEPDNAVIIACDYWNSRDINPLADADDVNAVTRKINGGLNGLDDRRAYLARAKVVLI